MNILLWSNDMTKKTGLSVTSEADQSEAKLLGFFRNIAVIILLTTISSAVFAGVYRCDIDGRKVYQDTPCPGDAVIVNTSPAVATVDHVSSMEWRGSYEQQFNMMIGVMTDSCDYAKACVIELGNLYRSNGVHCTKFLTFMDARGYPVTQRYGDDTFLSAWAKEMAEKNKIKQAEQAIRDINSCTDPIKRTLNLMAEYK